MWPLAMRNTGKNWSALREGLRGGERRRREPWSYVAPLKRVRQWKVVLGLPLPYPIPKAPSPGPSEWAEAGGSGGAKAQGGQGGARGPRRWPGALGPLPCCCV